MVFLYFAEETFKNKTMKALSIIGIIVSLAGLLTGVYTMSEGHCYCSGSYDYSYGYYGSNSYTDDDVTVGATLFMLISLFFLVFSIIATAVSFRKKNNVPPYAGMQQPGYYNQPYNQGYNPNYSQGYQNQPNL
ncbi:MAG: hypothetical protein FD123_4338, partial [Bacteroidetes bacterium]